LGKLTTVPTIDPNYRANATRSIFVFGDINDSLVSKLGQQILTLRASGDVSPITVYINSLGGSIRCMEYIYGLLSTKDLGGKGPRIITVAVGNCASAAASLLSLGDYAISYPKADIHFHGVRYRKAEDVTVESASSMVEQLENRNRLIASLLATAGTKRLAFLYARLKDKFEIARKESNNPKLSEIECFAHCLQAELSHSGDRIVDRAIKRWRSLCELRQEVAEKARQTGKQGLRFEAHVLKKIIDFEVVKNKTAEWCLDEEGVFQVVSDYLLLREYDMGDHMALVKNIAQLYGHAFFGDDEMKQILAASKTDEFEAIKPMVLKRFAEAITPFCYFAASIWQGLQRDENPLNPKEAYWLGAVDEVYDSGLPCKRELAEEDDPEQPDLPTASPSQPSS
jgi:ATP-dependent protease ClpP protease subunit